MIIAMNLSLGNKERKMIKCDNCGKEMRGKATFGTFKHEGVCLECYDKEMHTNFSAPIDEEKEAESAMWRNYREQ